MLPSSFFVQLTHLLGFSLNILLIMFIAMFNTQNYINFYYIINVLLISEILNYVTFIHLTYTVRVKKVKDIYLSGYLGTILINGIGIIYFIYETLLYTGIWTTSSGYEKIYEGDGNYWFTCSVITMNISVILFLSFKIFFYFVNTPRIK